MEVAGKIQILNYLVIPNGIRPRQTVEMRDVDLRFLCFSFCLYFHPNAAVPNSLNILISQLFDSPSPAYQNLLEERQCFWSFFCSQWVQYLGQCKLS